MALDYRKYGHLDDFQQKVAEKNPVDFPSGITGYEQYYVDMEGFWRQIYSKEPVYIRVYNSSPEDLSNYYIKNADGSYGSAKTEYNKDTEYYIISPDYNYKTGWHKSVTEDPSSLPFWIDFLDTTGELSTFSVPAIKNRPKVVNNKDVKAIYYRDTPGISFGSPPTENPQDGYRYLQLESSLYSKMFSPSAQGKSAKEAIDELMYTHAACINSVTITSAPIYHLEPNSIIYINDIESGINGYYTISKLTMPLAYNGTMNITATKTIDRLL